MDKSVSSQHSRLHAMETACEHRGFNTYETVDKRVLPSIISTSGEPNYGTITADVNAGLRFPQSRQMNLENFNSGCINPYGCVSNVEEGFACSGPLKEPSPALSTLYKHLNSPYAPNSFEMKNPPEYVVGIKESSVNSVLGWQRKPNDPTVLEWHANAHREPCASA